MTGLIRTPFGFSSTAEQVMAGLDLTGKRAIVTGGASGIGIETARALASAGAEVVLAVRRPSIAEDVPAEFGLRRGILTSESPPWTCPICVRFTRSPGVGRARCTCSSTTRA